MLAVFETSVATACIHRRFCELLPEDLLWVENPDTWERLRLIPGEFHRRDGRVGDHIAGSPSALPRFLARFQDVYAHLGKADWIISTAAAHHRLLWLHPILDGNGRVARLISHAMLLGVLDIGAVWSIARGLTRNVQQYKTQDPACQSRPAPPQRPRGGAGR